MSRESQCVSCSRVECVDAASIDGEVCFAKRTGARVDLSVWDEHAVLSSSKYARSVPARGHTEAGMDSRRAASVNVSHGEMR